MGIFLLAQLLWSGEADLGVIPAATEAAGEISEFAQGGAKTRKGEEKRILRLHSEGLMSAFMQD